MLSERISLIHCSPALNSLLLEKYNLHFYEVIKKELQVGNISKTLYMYMYRIYIDRLHC